MNAVPVDLGQVYGGFGECRGLLREEGGDLVLEFRTKDAILGIVESGVESARIPREAIASLFFHKRWFGSRLVIQTTHMEPIANVPGMSMGWLSLGVARKDREAAARLVSDLRLPDSAPVKLPPQEAGLE